MNSFIYTNKTLDQGSASYKPVTKFGLPSKNIFPETWLLISITNANSSFVLILYLCCFLLVVKLSFFFITQCSFIVLKLFLIDFRKGLFLFLVAH